MLLDDRKENIEPAWSPDGTWIVFTAQEEGSTTIWEVASSGNEPQPLVSENRGERFPSWSPKGEEIAFASKRAGSYDIWSLDVNGKTLRQITNEPGEELHPRWSHDGSMIAFVCDGRLAIVESSGGPLTYLTQGADSVQELCWDETGGAVIFSSKIEGEKYLFKFHIDSQIVEPVRTPVMRGGYPAVAPMATATYDLVGPQLAFESSGGSKIYSFNDNKIRPIVLFGQNPCWSPAGNQIVYSQNGNLYVDTVWILFDE